MENLLTLSSREINKLVDAAIHAATVAYEAGSMGEDMDSEEERAIEILIKAYKRIGLEMTAKKARTKLMLNH